MTSRLDPRLIPDAPDLRFESALWQAGVQQVAGIDEAGRGAWAGSVAAAAVILPRDETLLETLRGVRDSKQLSPARRSALAPVIQATAVTWAVGYASSLEIDDYGILFATRLAMSRAVASLSQPPHHLLIDALFLPEYPIPQTALLKGDQRSLSIAAASILAKTARDALMTQMEVNYPGYGFALHKGYGTQHHRQALLQLGPCPEHRMSFAPLKSGTPMEIENQNYRI
jgi:ribonuclease HII